MRHTYVRLVLGILIGWITVAEVAAQGLTGVGAEVSRHKALYYSDFPCSNLSPLQSGSSVMLGILRLNGTARMDDSGDCVPYALPAGFALVITKLSWDTSDINNACTYATLILKDDVLPDRNIFRGGGVSSARSGGCSHEVDFGSGLLVQSGGSVLNVQVPVGSINHVNLQGYLVRP